MSGTDKKIFQNVLVLGVTDIGAKGLTLVLMIVMARELGPVLMGVHAFGMAVAGMLQIFMDFGLNPFIQREVGRTPQSAATMVSEILSLKLGIAAIAVVGLLATIPFLAMDSPKREVVLILSGAMFFHSSTGAVCACFRALQLSHIEAMVRLSFRAAYTVIGLLILLMGGGIIALVSLELASAFMAFVLAFHWLRKRIGSPIGILSRKRAFQLMKKAWSFLFINIVQTIYNSIDMLMLSLMGGDLYTGYYALATRLFDAFEFLPGALAGGFLPVLSREASARGAEFNRVLGAYFKWNMLLGTSLGVGLAAFAEDVVPLLFGPKFIPAIPTMRLMGIAMVLTSVNWPLTTTIISLNRESRILRMFTLGAVVNVLLNLWFIPVFKDQGTAWTSIISAVLFICLQGKALGADVRHEGRLAYLAMGPLTCGVFTFLLVHYVRYFDLGLVVNAVVAVTGFLLLALATKTLHFDDLVRVKEYLVLRSKRTA